MAQEKSFADVRREGQSYADLLNSVSVVDEETAKQEKKLAAKKNKYFADKLVVDTIIETISREPLDLTKLIAQVNEETGVSKANCRKIVDRYKGTELDEFVFWRMEVGAHNSKTLSRLTLGVEKLEN